MRLLLLLLCWAATPALGVPDARKALLKETIGQLEQALKSGDRSLVRQALWRAAAIRDRYDNDEALPLAKAVAAGLDHETLEIAQRSAQTLGKMRVEGTGKFLAAHLAAAHRAEPARASFFVAVIAAAGALQGPACERELRRLLHHEWVDFAVSAARALGEFWILDEKEALAFLARLVPDLDQVERDIATAVEGEEIEAEQRLGEVRNALVNALIRVSGAHGPLTAKEWDAWIKEAKKKLRS